MDENPFFIINQDNNFKNVQENSESFRASRRYRSNIPDIKVPRSRTNSIYSENHIESELPMINLKH